MGKKQQSTAKKHKQQRGEKAAPAAGGETEPTERRQKGSKQRRRANREHHWAEDDLEKELAVVGLRIKTIEADGNCFFRAVLDQLEGDGGDHLRLRGRVMDFIEEREEEYKFFIEDDEPWDKYIKRMRKDGAWAGQLELQATSLLLQRNISVYQAGQPVWHINNCGADAPVLHLSYHDGMHYNSVRNADDYGSGPPEPLRMGSSSAALADPAAVAAAARSFGAREVEQVVAGTGCRDRERVAAVLEQCSGSIDQAIEVLIEQLGQEEDEDSAAAQQGEGAQQQQQQQQQQEKQRAKQQQQQEKQQAKQQQHVEQPRSQEPAPAPSPDAQQQAGSARRGSETPPACQGVVEQQQPCDSWAQLELHASADDPSRVSLELRLHPLTQLWKQDQEEQRQRDNVQRDEQPDASEEAVAGAGGTPRLSGKRAGSKRGIRVKEGKQAAAGRNRRCPCGSTKKYKNCCGALRGERGAAALGRAPAASEGGDAGSAAGEAAKQLQVLYI